MTDHDLTRKPDDIVRINYIEPDAPRSPPREPNAAMIDAGDHAWNTGPNLDRDMLKFIWRAMYDAAPAPRAELSQWREVGWICADGFPALISSKPCEPGTKLYALAPPAPAEPDVDESYSHEWVGDPESCRYCHVPRPWNDALDKKRCSNRSPDAPRAKVGPASPMASSKLEADFGKRAPAELRFDLAWLISAINVHRHLGVPEPGPKFGEWVRENDRWLREASTMLMRIFASPAPAEAGPATEPDVTPTGARGAPSDGVVRQAGETVNPEVELQSQMNALRGPGYAPAALESLQAQLAERERGIAECEEICERKHQMVVSYERQIHAAECRAEAARKCIEAADAMLKYTTVATGDPQARAAVSAYNTARAALRELEAQAVNKKGANDGERT